jgi:hypothetical protein
MFFLMSKGIIYARHGRFQSSFLLECRSMGFCIEECSNEYFLEYRYKVAMAMEVKSRRTRSKARKASVAEGEVAVGYKCIFFICAEVESFP